MQQMRLDSREGIANGWAGAGVTDARNLPERAKAPAGQLGENADAQSGRRSLVGTALRFVRNAVVGLALITAIPIALVGWRSQHLRFNPNTRLRDRIERLDPLRPLMVPKDPSVTPLEAGVAFNAIQSYRPNQQQFPRVNVPLTAERPWRSNKVSDDMFASSGPRQPGFSGPSPQHIVEVAPGGFSERELTWLRQVAEAPVWKNFDIVAAAPSVDMIGGQYQLPFREDAVLHMMPLRNFSDTKELAYAGVSRAAYYLAIGQPAMAERALNSVVSFGFALIDNGNSLMDAVTGAAIVNIGRDGLAQFNLATRGVNAIATVNPAANAVATENSTTALRVSASELRQQLLRDLSDADLPRGLRMERLNSLSYATCRNIPEMIFGPNEETRAAIASARSSLARYPSEQALVDLALDATNHIPENGPILFAPERLVMGAAAVASTITGNPRFSTCTRMAISYW